MSGETVFSKAADLIRERGWWDGTTADVLLVLKELHVEAGGA